MVERGGAIRLVLDGEKRDVPFLTIPNLETAGEAGLLSIAFPPDYAASGLFYVFLVPADGTPGAAPWPPIEVREYRRAAADPNLADAASARLVLAIPHAGASNHYGGGLQFGPDGLLYVSTGDGGSGQSGNGQNRFSRLGKILRFDPRESGTDEFSVPPTNPFADGAEGDPLVWSYGLRNPYRFSFDRSTGDLTLGDVGENRFEEINHARAAGGRGRGANFGWAACEGFFAFASPTTPCTLPGHTPPAFAYPHASDPCSGSIIGGVVVRDPALPSLAGRYLYGDFCEDFVRSICLPSGAGDASTGLPVDLLAAFGEDAAGRVLVVQLGGSVARVTGSTSVGPCPRAAPGGGTAPVGIPGATPAFTFTLGGARRQRPLRSGNVGVKVHCSAACSARARGRLSLKLRGRRIRLRQALAGRAVAGTLTLRLRLPAKARRPLRRVLRARKRVRAGITVRVRDGAGTLAVRERFVRLAR